MGSGSDSASPALLERLEQIVAALRDDVRGTSLVVGLERLVQLHRDGWLDDEEFALAKRRILHDRPPPGDLRRVGPGAHRRTLCIDFDGVLHSYASGWHGPTEIPDPPTEGAIEWLTLAAERFDLAIVSVRNAYPGAIESMQAWLERHGLSERVLSRVRFPTHKPPAELYIDDRAYRFEGSFPSFDEIGALEPWYRSSD